MADGFGTGCRQNRHLRNMLTEGIHSDVTIVACDGEKIRCHKFILTGESDVFEAMFRSTSKSNELVTGTIHMKDMCSKSVKAFLSFLYLDDIQTANEDSSVSLDLLKAGNKYNVPQMEEQMKRILQEKPDNWYNIEVAMQLYFLAKNLEDGDGLKKKSLNEVLYESAAYIQLFEKEPRAARDLCADLNFHQPSPQPENQDTLIEFNGRPIYAAPMFSRRPSQRWQF